LCTYVKVLLSTPRIFPEGQSFTKNYHFWRFFVPYGHSFKARTLKFRTIVRLGAPSPMQNFVKIAEGNIPLWGKGIPQISIFGDFGAVSPHLLSQNGKVWREGANLGDPSLCKIFEKSLKGIYPFGENSYQKLPTSVFLWARKSSSMRFQQIFSVIS